MSNGTQERRRYNQGELIADIGATTLTNCCGIPTRGYIRADRDMVRDWIEQIRADIGYLTMACLVAEVATGYVVNHRLWEVPA
jgi:hypothetical protein